MVVEVALRLFEGLLNEYVMYVQYMLKQFQRYLNRLIHETQDMIIAQSPERQTRSHDIDKAGAACVVVGQFVFRLCRINMQLEQLNI